MKPSQEDAAQKQLGARQRWTIAYAKQTDVLNQLKNDSPISKSLEVPSARKIRDTCV